MKTPELVERLKDLYRDEVDELKKRLLKDLKHMRKKQLESLLNEIGLNCNGTTEELRKRLVDFYEANWTPVQQEAKKDATKESGKKKKWRVTDPAEIAPNFYHEDLFTANFPLVAVKKYYAGQVFPVTDKFEGVVLKLRQTKRARSLWSDRLMDVVSAYKMPANEKQAFPHHLALVEGIVQFTTPGPELIDKVENLRKRKRAAEEAEEFEGSAKVVSVEDVDEESYNGLLIAAVEEDQVAVLTRGSGSKNEGGQILPEGSVDLTGILQEHEGVPTGFADALISVHDKRPVLRAAKRLKQGIEETAETINIHTERVAAILERKFVEDRSKSDAPFQGAFYAAKHALVNIQNGHGTPVYVVVMTAQKWCYGVLVPEGFIHVRDGKVDPRSFDAFKGHQEITGVAEHSLETLQEKLAAGTEFYRKNFRDNPQAKYRNGPMLVGTYYLRDEWFSLPTTEHGGFGTDGALRLFDGLMRVALGDSVLKMTDEDLVKRVKKRFKLKEELKSDFW